MNTSVENLEYNSITTYRGMDGFRKKLSMYIGGTQSEDGTVPPAVTQMGQEVITNSVDEFGSGFGDVIELTIFKDNSFRINDRGRGIPEGDKESLQDAIDSFTEMHSTGKNANSGYAHSGVGGTHGVGNTALNAGSAWLVVEVRRSVDDFSYRLVFEKGRLVEKVPHADLSNNPWFADGQCGTSITFLPDTGAVSEDDPQPVLASNNWDAQEMMRRAQWSAVLNPGLMVNFIDEREGTSETFLYPKGVRSYWNEKGIIDKDIITVDATAEIDGYIFTGHFAMTPGAGTARYFSNGVPNKHGGTHEIGFRASIAQAFTDYVGDAKTKFAVGDVMSILDVVVSIDVPSDIVSYENQVKDTLTTALANRAVRQMVKVTLADALYDNKHISDTIAKTLKEVLADRIALSKAQKALEEGKGKDSKRKRDIALTIDVMRAKSKNPAEREFYMVEGKSASNIGRDTLIQALLPLRGKPLNVAQAKISKVLTTAEVVTILEEIGGDNGEDFDISKCRYSKIILTPDADVDGGHIVSLLILILATFKPGLIESGRVYYIQAPLFKATKYIKGNPTNRYFYSDAEINAERPSLMKDGWDITRFKGLGEMKPEDAHFALANKKTRRMHRIVIGDINELKSALKMLFEKDATARRRWLLDDESTNFFNVDGELNELKLDYALAEASDVMHTIDARNLLFKYMAEYFAYVVLSRAVPDDRDGLKPVQRRIDLEMGRMGLTSIKKHVKLAKISGAVSGNFHPHGTSAISDASTHLALPWSNRLPLVDISGNMGTVGGEDAGADRYIEARPTFIGEAMYEGINKNAVDMMDNYDSTQKEPVVLPSPVPYGLINGNRGIAAAGMSSLCLPHSPYEALDLLRLSYKGQLNVENASKVYHGIDLPTGNELIGSHEDAIADLTSHNASFTIRARWRVEKHTLVVEEALYGTKTTKTKEAIVKWVDELPEITDIYDESGAFPDVRITIDFRKGTTKERIEQIGHFLESKKVLTTDLHPNNLYISNGRPRHMNVMEQVESFAQFRRETLTRIWTYEKAVATRNRHLRQAELDIVLNLEEVKRKLDESRSKAELKAWVMDRFDLDDEQGEYIISLAIHRFLSQDTERLDKIREAIEGFTATINERNLWLGEGMLDALLADVDRTEQLLEKNKVQRRTTVLGEPIKSVKVAKVTQRKVTSLSRQVAVSTSAPVIYSAPTLEPDDDTVMIDTRTDRFIGAVMPNGSLIVRQVVDLDSENRMNRVMDSIRAEDSFLSVFEFNEKMSLLTFSKMGYCKLIPMSKLMPSTSTARYKNVMYKVSDLKKGTDELVHIYPVSNVSSLDISVRVKSKRNPLKRIDVNKLSQRSDTGASSGAIFFDTAKGKNPIESIDIVERGDDDVRLSTDS